MSSKDRQITFTPPFCPNSKCVHHRHAELGFAKKNGITKTIKQPCLNQRFLCKTCDAQFSENTFKFDFRKKLFYYPKISFIFQ